MSGATLFRFGAGAVAVAAFAGLVLIQAPPSQAIDGDSSLTVKWTGDSGAAATLQPTRDPAGAEFGEFKNITVKIGQTQNLTDQAVRVDVSGFTGGTSQATDGTGQLWTSAQNFMQAMQCWGDPASPDFRQTCEWGGRYVQNNGLGFSVYRDNVFRIAEQDVSPTATNVVDNPFKPRVGDPVTAREVLDDGAKQYPIRQFFGADSTNEVQSALIKNDGTGTFDFEMQTADQAPQLGCGDGTAQLTCYLVLVPRGTIYEGHDGACSGIFDRNGVSYTYGRPNSIQAGSPMNPGCDYWDNRIVVPLHFNPIAAPCPGGAEQRVIGSQLLIGAMASWQPSLCTVAGATYSFATNADAVARADLVDRRASLAFTSYPVIRSDLDPPDQPAFDTSQLSYAPVAIGGLTVSFLADGKKGLIDDMTLSPLLLAKLLTQSYIFEIPNTGTDPGDSDFLQLGAKNRSYTFLSQDPDFQALNPNWDDFIGNPSIVLPGPAGADSIAQLWKWIQSDTAARDFLSGKPDAHGMTVNPYYLPKGAPGAQVPTFAEDGTQDPNLKPVGQINLDGSPSSLATAPINYFPKADDSHVPHKLGIEKSRFDSIQFSPYVDDFVKSAITTFRANPGPKISWDPTAVTDDPTKPGDWVTTGPQVPGRRFVIAIMDAASSARYDLDDVRLQAANGTVTTVPDNTSMSAAVSTGLVATANPSVAQIDPTKVSANGYPLTTVVYAAVNLPATQAPDRANLSKMIAFVAGDGQKPGTAIGELPEGYLPLTSALAAQAKAASVAIASWVPASGNTDDGSGVVINGGDGDGFVGGDDGAGATGDGTTPETSSLPPTSDARTPAAAVSPVNPTSLTIILGLAAAGAVFGPLLFRGRSRP